MDCWLLACCAGSQARTVSGRGGTATSDASYVTYAITDAALRYGALLKNRSFT